MNGENVFNTLDLEDYFTLDKQIEPISAIELDALVFHR